MSSFERRNYNDQLNIDTPEQVDLTFNVAGVGSRFVAALLDMLIVTVVYFLEILGFVLLAAGATAGGGNNGALDTAAKWVIAFIIFVNFAFFWGYYALFEAYWRGQTPGKRVMKLRVIKDSGRQITLFESLARNLIRVVDYLPSLYLVGVVTMLCNQRNKRLGDFAAGTIVVHERTDEQPLLYQTSTTLVAPVGFTAQPGSQPWQQETLAPWAKPVTAIFPADSVARLTAQDLVAIEAFFARMLDLPLETRAAIAYRMAGQMCAKMGVPVPEMNPERALEAMAYQMRGSGRAF
jgi:uncharacterized RDD family membrane protein YckC